MTSCIENAYNSIYSVLLFNQSAAALRTVRLSILSVNLIVISLRYESPLYARVSWRFPFSLYPLLQSALPVHADYHGLFVGFSSSSTFLLALFFVNFLPGYAQWAKLAKITRSVFTATCFSNVAVMPSLDVRLSVRLSVCPSVTLVIPDHIRRARWNFITRLISPMSSLAARKISAI